MTRVCRAAAHSWTGDTLTLSSATGRFWECRCSYSNLHISKVSTQKCSLKSYPLFMPRTTQRQISVHSLQSQTLQGHCCSTSSQHTTSYTARLVLSVAVQPSWALTWILQPHRHRKTPSHFCLQLQNISGLSCFTASEKGKLFPSFFSQI